MELIQAAAEMRVLEGRTEGVRRFIGKGVKGGSRGRLEQRLKSRDKRAEVEIEIPLNREGFSAKDSIHDESKGKIRNGHEGGEGRYNIHSTLARALVHHTRK